MANITNKRKSIFNRVANLFSSGGVVARHIGGKKFKVVDTNSIQGLGNKNLRRDRFQKLFTHQSEAGSGYGLTNSSGYGAAGVGSATHYGNRGYQQQNIEFQRNKIYVDYELMDKDPIISSALDILADECLSGDTIIPLLNGDKITLKELYDKKYNDFWIYGLDEEAKTFKPIKAERVAYNGKKKIKIIKFDDGTEIKSTDNHIWVLPNGDYKKTSELQIGDGILNLPTRISNTKIMKGYEQIWNPDKSKFEYTHRVIGNGILLDSKNKINKLDKPVLHHISLNKFNNDPDLLEWMTWSDHNKLHAEINRRVWGDEADPDIKKKYKKNQKEGVERFWKSKKSDETRKRWSLIRKERFSKMSREERVRAHGHPGKSNGMYGNGHKVSGPKNGRYNPKLKRYTEIDENYVYRRIAEEPTRNIFSKIMSELNIAHSEWVKFSRIQMKKFGATNGNNLRIKILLNENYDLINKFRKYCLDEYNPEKRFLLSKFFKENNTDMSYLRKVICSGAGYQTLEDFAKSNNHKIVSINDGGYEDVYDIVNAGDNHIYAIEMNDGSKLYTHNCTVHNEYGELLIIQSDNQDIKDILENLFIDILNLEFNLNAWVRNLVKYGDFYLALDLVENNGIVNAYPLSPYFVYRLEGQDPNNQYDVKFKYDLGDGKTEEYEQFEVAHFRMLGDTSFLPYGKSMAENARFIFKQLYLMEEAMMIHRIMRAPEKRVFKIDVGNLPDEEVNNYLNKVVNKSKKTPIMDENTGQYNLKYNMQNILEDFYIPVRGAHSSAEIESLSGLEYNAIEDIEYLRDKLFAALKVPKPYLSFEADIDGKATLAAEDVKFAKTIQRIQKVVVSELTKIAVIHLYLQGYRNADITNFKIELVNPSIIFEKEMIDLLNQKSDLMTSLVDNKIMSKKRAYELIFNYTDDDIKKEQSNIIEDHKMKFRLEQIEMEGNDPLVSGESYGTPHDIASMHTANRGEPGSEEGGQPGAGRKKQYGSDYNTDRDTFGRDPIGRKNSMQQMGLDKDLKHNFRSSSPLNNETIKYKKKLIFEGSKETDMDENKGTFLDESNIRE